MTEFIYLIKRDFCYVTIVLAPNSSFVIDDLLPSSVFAVVKHLRVIETASIGLHSVS
jgi:hypothetical protein